MQHSISDLTVTERVRYTPAAQRPGVLKRAQFFFMIALFVVDIGSVWLGFWAAHAFLVRDPDFIIGPFREFLLLPGTYTAVMVVIYFSQRMYQRRRPVTHLDEFFQIIIYNVLATALHGGAADALRARVPVSPRLDSARRRAHDRVRHICARDSRPGPVAGAGTRHRRRPRAADRRRRDRAACCCRRCCSSPKLGYQVIGVVDAGKGERDADGRRCADPGRAGRRAVAHRPLRRRRSDHRPARKQPPGPGQHHQPVRAREGGHPRLPGRLPDHGQRGHHRRPGRPAAADDPRRGAARLEAGASSAAWI